MTRRSIPCARNSTRVIRDKDNLAARQPVGIGNMGGDRPVWQIVNICEAW